MKPRNWGEIKPVNAEMAFVKHGLGDNIYRLGVFRDLLLSSKHIKLLKIFAPDYFAPVAEFFFDKFGLSSRTKVYKFSEFEEKTDPRWIGVPDRNTGQFTSMRTHLKAYAQSAILNKVDLDGINGEPFRCKPEWLESIKKPYTGRTNYAVVCTGYTSAVREFRPSLINEIVDDLLKRGLTPVFLGKKDYYDGVEKYSIKYGSGVCYKKGIDLRDQTTILEAFKVINGAALVVGVDNGLMHIAYTTDTPVVGGFTTVSPNIRIPFAAKVLTIAPEGDCKFCQSDWHPMYWTEKEGNTYTHKSHDFLNCFHGDLQCVKNLQFKDFKHAIDTVLDDRVGWY